MSQEGKFKSMMQEEREIKSFLGKSTAKKSSVLQVRRIPGDASSRHYFRVKAGSTKLIVMKMEAFHRQAKEPTFLQVQKHLENLSVAVPKIIDVDARRGLILLEDLGDETLLKRLEGVSRHRDQTIWFKRAIDLVVSLHSIATVRVAPIDAYGLFFDEAKLMWEVRFTLDYFYNGKIAPVMSTTDRRHIERYFSLICKRLAAEPWVFTHRDYHSRNIMVHKGDLFLIDFQDARMGTCFYDLASLLRDSYYQLEEDLIYELLEYYMVKLKKAGMKNIVPPSATKAKELFDLMSIQRNFKAIGSFASFYEKRNDARYLKFIGNTFENVRKNLLKIPELDHLRRLLYRNYYF